MPAVRIRRLLVAVALVATAACGVQDEDRPRQLANDAVPPDLLEPASTTPGSTTPETGVTTTVGLFFVGTGRLVKAEREIEAPATPAEVIELLLRGPSSDEQDRGISTEIPPGTELLDATVNRRSGVLTIDLSDQINDIAREAQQRAIAQLVFTATDLPTVDDVVFEVEGEATPVPVGDGPQQSGPVNRLDYPQLRPRG